MVVAAGRLIVPPERVTLLVVALPNLMDAAFTVPETVIVPPPKATESVPKCTGSAVVVVMLAPGVAVPAVLVLQRLAVGAAHVPAPLPKPEVVLLASQ